MNDKVLKCNISKKCGSCQLLNKTYNETLQIKLNNVNNLLKQNKINYQIFVKFKITVLNFFLLVTQM